MNPYIQKLLMAAASVLPPVTSLSYLDGDTDDQDAAPATATIPATTKYGDLIIVSVHALTNTGAPDFGPPAVPALDGSYTSLVTAVSGGWRQTILGKIAKSSDAGGDLTSNEGVVVNRIIIAVYRGNYPIKSISPLNLHSEGTSGNPASQTVTSSGGTPPLIVFGGFTTGTNPGAVSPRTFSPAKDSENNSGLEHYLAWKIYNGGDTPVNHSIDMDDEGFDNVLESFYLQCS